MGGLVLEGGDDKSCMTLVYHEGLGFIGLRA